MGTLKGVTKSDVYWTVDLYDFDGTPFDLTTPSAWTVTATLYDLAAETQVGSSAAQSSGETGADWANGRVVVKLPAAASAAVDSGKYGLEVRAVNGVNERRWQHEDVQLKKGVLA